MTNNAQVGTIVNMKLEGPRPVCQHVEARENEHTSQTPSLLTLWFNRLISNSHTNLILPSEKTLQI